MDLHPDLAMAAQHTLAVVGKADGEKEKARPDCEMHSNNAAGYHYLAVTATLAGLGVNWNSGTEAAIRALTRSKVASSVPGAQ